MNESPAGPVLVPVPGGALAVDSRRGAEPAVVLLHSGIGDRRGFAALVEHLDPEIGVVAYDRRGHGDSTATGDGPHADDLLAVLDRLGIGRAWLVGSSAGGQVALETALLHPERVAGLVLLAPVISGAPEGVDDETVLRFDRMLDEAGDDVEERIRLETWLWLDGPAGPEGRVTGPGRVLLAEMDRTTIEHGRSELDGTTVTDIWNELPRLRHPVAFVAGSIDLPSIVERSAAAAERTPNGRHILMPERAHLPYLEDAAGCGRLIRELIEDRSSRPCDPAGRA